MLQKRLDYGFSGYQVPFIPRAARSSRKRRPIREKVVAVDNQLCAFDLLATVAGKLLEGESSQNLPIEKDQLGDIQDVVMQEQDEGTLCLKDEHCTKGGNEVASLNLELGLQVHDQGCDVKENSGPQNDSSPAPVSVITSSHCTEKDEFLVKMDTNDDKSDFCSLSRNTEGFAPGHTDSCAPNVNESVEEHDGKGEVLSGNGLDMHCSEDPEFFDGISPAVASSDCSIKLSLGVDHYPCGSLSPRRDNNVKVVTRDDDENSSECTQPSTMKAARLPARIGDRRIRKLLASKHWRLASKVKDGDHSDTGLRCIYRSRRTGYKRPRSQRIYPFKKRKFYHYSSLLNSDVDDGCKGNGSSSCVAGQSTSFASRESHVKLRIKSFRVPELFIEMPETATVGSLKRTVMEAVTALLGGGLRVGVRLQGKKIRDDNRTLVQSGICHDDKVESLGFTLEPNPSHISTPVSSEDNSLLLSTDLPQPVSRCPTLSANNQGASHHHPVTNLGNFVESDHDSAPSPAEITAEKGSVDSRALVALPEGTPQALAVVPSHQKSKRSEMAQRRIRRPFSVTEVESLVQAVEKLGTGRWRDVKLRAFDNVKHRTYVDLKDKWKTLVHTARISPQQRRGEPVPQELLDRVLAAHSYWSQQQAKQQLKQQPSDACLLL
ncbi:telomere repeat-binding protein 2-like [Chenopodium quinoa]|uniref:telomere repeat-binding protein 2-like n=1 Tax=Chenopodium quinoa TaxID=63459 RepID=UPI000B78856A|nr:telomere repeat-binding protein 2-like [Chenopodium quinoa]